MQADGGTATQAFLDAEAKARDVGDLPLLARALALSARVRAMTGDLEGARAQASEAESVALGLDDPAVDAALAGTQGFLAQAGQDLVGARRLYCESVPRARAAVTSTRSFMPWRITASHWSAAVKQRK